MLTKNNLLILENKRLKQSNDSLLSIKSKESYKSETKETKSVTWWKWFIAGLCLPVIVWVSMNWTKIVFPWIKKLFEFVKKII